jgi:glycerol-3-phosphate acyltransferase PlsY
MNKEALKRTFISFLKVSAVVVILMFVIFYFPLGFLFLLFVPFVMLIKLIYEGHKVNIERENLLKEQKSS